MGYDNLDNSEEQAQWRIKAEHLYAANDLFTPHTAKRFPLGAMAEARDGRLWWYCKAGAIITKAKAIQSVAGTGNWQDEVQTNNPSFPVVTDKLLTVTLTATATKDQFANGWLSVEEGTGEDELYLIKGNKAGVANATTGYDVVIEIADQGGLRVAYVAASTLTVTLNKYEDVITAPANPTGVLVGVSLATVADNEYFWAQSKGPAPVTVDDTDTIVVGDMVMVSTDATIPGACALADAGADDHVIGLCMRAAATSETAVIDLTIG